MIWPLVTSPANFLTGLEFAEFSEFPEGNAYPTAFAAHVSQSLGFVVRNCHGRSGVMVAELARAGNFKSSKVPY